MRKTTPAHVRFWAKVEKTDTCWLWTAAQNGRGYGSFGLSPRRMVGAHRFAYELEVGPIPDGMEIDHLCRVRNCVNPGHLEAVTHRVNILRSDAPPGLRARMTLCKRGHELSVRRDTGARICKTCDAHRARQKYHAKRSRTAALNESEVQR